MPESRDINRPDAFETAWELIPWYVNGSLPENEAALVRDQARISPQLAAEIARQRVLAQQVATVDPSEAPVDRSWEKLRAQIASEKRAQMPRQEAKGWLAGLRGGYALGGLGVAACVLLAVLLVEPAGVTYRTLTSSPETGPAIKFQLAGDLAEGELTQLLAAHGLTLLEGPSDAGVYTASAAPGVDLARAAKDLMATANVQFAAPAE